MMNVYYMAVYYTVFWAPTVRYGTVYGRFIGEDTVRYGRNLKMRLRSIPTCNDHSCLFYPYSNNSRLNIVISL